MGPPLISGGNLMSTMDVRLTKVGFNGAAAHQRRKPPGDVLDDFMKWLLQWGRRSSAAETRATVRRDDGYRRRFNGAAAHQRRKRERRKDVSHPSKTLQWGRRSSAAETCFVAATASLILS